MSDRGSHATRREGQLTPGDEAWKPLAFVATAMFRTLMLPFEGAFMAGMALGVAVAGDVFVRLGALGFDTRANVMWADEMLGEMWQGTKDMAHSLGTAEGWQEWWDQTSYQYNEGDAWDAAIRRESQLSGPRSLDARGD